MKNSKGTNNRTYYGSYFNGKYIKETHWSRPIQSGSTYTRDSRVYLSGCNNPNKGDRNWSQKCKVCGPKTLTEGAKATCKSGYQAQYNSCIKEVVKDYELICPSGYTYNSTVRKCQK